MKLNPQGRIYLAKQIEHKNEPKNGALTVNSNGKNFQLNTGYNDNPEGIRIAEETKAHLEKVCRGMVFAILRAIKTPDGHRYEEIRVQPKGMQICKP